LTAWTYPAARAGAQRHGPHLQVRRHGQPGQRPRAAEQRRLVAGVEPSPTMRTVTCSVPVFTVAVSPPGRCGNAVLTSTSPGAWYQRPEMIPNPIRRSRRRAHKAFVNRDTGDLDLVAVGRHRVPRARLGRGAAAAASCAAPGGAASHRRGELLARTGMVAEWPRPRRGLSPNAKITAVVPNAIAASVTAVRGPGERAAGPRQASAAAAGRRASGQLPWLPAGTEPRDRLRGETAAARSAGQNRPAAPGRTSRPGR
jgi:hypothetical protein